MVPGLLDEPSGAGHATFCGHTVECCMASNPLPEEGRVRLQDIGRGRGWQEEEGQNLSLKGPGVTQGWYLTQALKDELEKKLRKVWEPVEVRHKTDQKKCTEAGKF